MLRSLSLVIFRRRYFYQPQIEANVPMLYEGGELELQKVGLTTNFNKMQKSLINNETPAIGNVLLAAGVASKWKHYRDVHYRLYEATKDIESYEKSMKTHQTIIKNWMETYNEQLIEAVTNICKQEDDARYQLKILCAGYELASGVDYTCR